MDKFTENKIKQYKKQQAIADRVRPLRKSLCIERGITSKDWFSRKRLKDERAIIIWIAIEKFGASICLAEVIADMNSWRGVEKYYKYAQGSIAIRDQANELYHRCYGVSHAG